MTQHHKWTQEEERYLAENYRQGEGLHACAAYLGLPAGAVKQKAVRTGVASTRRNFTKEETAYIMDNYSRKGPKALAKEMGLNWQSIYELAKQKTANQMRPHRQERKRQTDK